MVATTAALGWFNALASSSGSAVQLRLVAVVTGAVGLVRFAALRWSFGATTHAGRAVASGPARGRVLTVAGRALAAI